MSSRDHQLLLMDMLDSARKILRYVEGMNFESFSADEKTIDAVVRNFEIIGEAANRIDADFKSQSPEISWSHLRGFRNRIVHDYFGVDYEIVWSIVDKDLEELIHQLELIISKSKL